MTPSGPLHIATRAELRAFLGGTLGGRSHGWPHLALRHNSLAHATPCRLCDGTARPHDGPEVFWDSDPLCPSCAAQVAPELACYHRALQRAIAAVGGDWRALSP